jgi:quercetin dioxygenase-like cupin family protein
MRKSVGIPMLAIVLVLVVAGTALATAASNFQGTITSRATLSHSIKAKTHEVKLKTKGPVDLVTATVNIAAGGSSGWHSHPGVVLVSVVSGSLVFYDHHCRATVHAAGSAFVESGNHAGLVRNESATTPAVVYATYLVPAGTPNASLRVDKPNPGCPQS